MSFLLVLSTCWTPEGKQGKEGRIMVVVVMVMVVVMVVGEVRWGLTAHLYQWLCIIGCAGAGPKAPQGPLDFFPIACVHLFPVFVYYSYNISLPHCIVPLGSLM